MPREECLLSTGYIERRLDNIEASLGKLWVKYDGRPTWAVLIIISFLSSLCVSLLVLLFSHL